MEQELLGILLAAAISLSGLPPVDVSELPPILRLPHARIVQEICPEGPASCQGMVAIFDTDRQRILVDDSLDLTLAEDNSFIVHELVHVLQFKSFGDSMYANCAASMRTEGQAYWVQNAYLKQEGRLLRLFQRIAFASCNNGWGAF